MSSDREWLVTFSDENRSKGSMFPLPLTSSASSSNNSTTSNRLIDHTKSDRKETKENKPFKPVLFCGVKRKIDNSKKEVRALSDLKRYFTPIPGRKLNDRQIKRLKDATAAMEKE